MPKIHGESQDIDKLNITQLPEAGVAVSSVKEIQRLAFSGGGAKGVVYPGVLSALVDWGVFKTVREISGSSAGSIVATFIASGMSMDMIRDKLLNINFLNLLGSRIGNIKGNPNGVLYNTKDAIPLLSFIRQSILDSVRTFFQKLDVSTLPADVVPIFKKLRQETPPPLFTFRDLATLTRHYPEQFKQVIITAVGISNGELQIFNSDLTPDVEIALASRASSAIPLFFEPVKIEINGKLERYIDGAYYDNLPSEYFDKDENNPKAFKPNQKMDQTLLFVFDSKRDSDPDALFRALHGGRWDEFVADKNLRKAIVDTAHQTHSLLLKSQAKHSSSEIINVFLQTLQKNIETTPPKASDEEKENKLIIISKMLMIMDTLKNNLRKNKSICNWMAHADLNNNIIDEKIEKLVQHIITSLRPVDYQESLAEKCLHSSFVKKIAGINADYDTLDLIKKSYQKIRSQYALRTVTLHVDPISTLDFNLATQLARTMNTIGYLDTVNFITSHNLHDVELRQSSSFYYEVTNNFETIYRAIILGARKRPENDLFFKELTALKAQLHDKPADIVNRQCCQFIQEKMTRDIPSPISFALSRAIEYANNQIPAEQLMKETYEESRRILGYKQTGKGINFDAIALKAKSFNPQLQTVFQALQKIEKFDSSYLDYYEQNNTQHFQLSHANYKSLLNTLKEKVSDLKKKAYPSPSHPDAKYVVAYKKAESLCERLDKLGTRFFVKKEISPTDFQTACKTTLDDAMRVLREHRCIAIINAGRRLYYWLINLVITVDYPMTASAKKVSDFNKGLEEIIEITRKP